MIPSIEIKQAESQESYTTYNGFGFHKFTIKAGVLMGVNAVLVNNKNDKYSSFVALDNSTDEDIKKTIDSKTGGVTTHYYSKDFYYNNQTGKKIYK